jgi:hypothetical protein
MPFSSFFKMNKSGKIVRPTNAQIISAAPKWHYDVEVFDKPRCLYSDAKLVDFRAADNLVTREGLGYLLNVGFKGGTGAAQKTTWYVTQYKTTNTGETTTATATTPTGTEITYNSGDVNQTVRPTLTLGAISTGADLTSVDNSALKAVFNHQGSITVYGLQLFSVSSAGTSAGYTGDILYGMTHYGTALAVQLGYEVDVQATLSATAG